MSNVHKYLQHIILISPRMLFTGWSLWMVWHTLGCGGVGLEVLSSLYPSSLSPPWSLLSSWTWSLCSSSFSSWSLSWSWSSSYVGGVVSLGVWPSGWSLWSCGITSPIAILCKTSHGASSSSIRSRSTCSFWEALVIRLGFPIFRKVQITIDLGGFETHRSGFKSKEMNPAILAPRILWLST
jgi:hypothetical protein